MKKNVETAALVIRTSDYKENDKMATLLSKEFGKIDVSMRGCRKQGAKLFAAASIFCCGDFSLNYDKDRFFAVGCDVKHIFYNLSEDIEKFAAATFICEVAADVATPMERHGALFAHVVNMLSFLEKDELSPKEALFCFAVKMCDIFGVRPILSECVLCGNEGRIGGFSIASGGVVCKDCSEIERVNPIKREHLESVAWVLAHKNSELLELEKIDDYVLRLMMKYMTVNLSIGRKRMEFLKKIGLIK